MNKTRAKKGWVFIKVILATYIIGGVVLYLIQDLLLFHPKPLSAQYQFQFSQPFTEHNILHETGRNLNILYFPVKDVKKGTILFFHGNMKNSEHYKKYIPFLTNTGFDVWMMDYPGFGKSTGKRSEEIMCKDALLVYNMATAQTSSDSLIIYGKSIGTGVAAQLASVRPCQRLILETPYYSLDALAKHYLPFYPVPPMSRYSFPIYQYLKKVAAPITILHGTKDEVIPFKQAKNLQEENKNIQLVIIRNGKHNNLLSFPLFQKTIDSILRR
jgi:pimeloyl-ACP methyl ester carboxylesterase